MPRGQYSTRFKPPRPKTEKRILIPQPPERPLHFQARGLIRKELLSKDPWWFTYHRRGVRRPYVGGDLLEARAVPHGQVRGTLPERIVYRALMEVVHLIPGPDFDMQSSLQGGRIELGGIVADFIFPLLRMVIQVQGPTHTEYLRVQKDREQTLALEEMGYQVYNIWEDTIYDEYKLEDWLRKTFGWNHSGGGFQGEPLGDYMGQFHTYGEITDDGEWDALHTLALDTLLDLRALEGYMDTTL